MKNQRLRRHFTYFSQLNVFFWKKWETPVQITISIILNSKISMQIYNHIYVPMSFLFQVNKLNLIHTTQSLTNLLHP